MTTEAWLYEHEDGRYAVAPGVESPAFTHNDPAWHRLGPVDVSALASPAPASEPEGVSPIDADYWLRRRAEIIDAVQAEGFRIVSNAERVWLKRIADARPSGEDAAVREALIAFVQKVANQTKFRSAGTKIGALIFEARRLIDDLPSARQSSASEGGK
jgi:hypothetical protein